MWLRIGIAIPSSVFLTSTIGYSLLLYFLASIATFRPDIADRANRVRDIKPERLRSKYDFIIVGGGSAGTVLANRLSELRSCKVLLIEAGQDEPFQNEPPLFWTTLQNTDVDWQFKTEPSAEYCTGSPNGMCAWIRGKMLGGSSSINAMFSVRGNRRDYDRWCEVGNSGWSYDDVLPYFKKSEDMRIGEFQDSPYHSTDGYLSHEHFRYASPLNDVYLASASELGLRSPTGDYNGATQLGFARAQANLRDGLRCSNNKAFIRSASHRRNLDVILESQVTEIIINPETKVATGVEFTRHGKSYEVFARKEVILSAGAIQSPQLLMLSGIGDAAELKKHGIPCIVDLPGVGQNLQDHVAFGGTLILINATNPPLSFITPELLNESNMNDFLRRSQGPFYGSPSDVFGFINSPFQDANDQWPDLQILILSLTNSNGDALITKQGSKADGFSILPTLLRPESRGSIRLRSCNPFDRPIIVPNYFKNSRDLKVLASSNNFIRKLLATKAMRDLNATLVPAPGCDKIDVNTNEYYECLSRLYTQSIWHPVGTCKMGPKRDCMAVVDSKLRVHGVKRLRVIDASIIPYITTGNVNSPTTMIAEKGADLIKEECYECAKYRKHHTSNGNDPPKHKTDTGISSPPKKSALEKISTLEITTHKKSAPKKLTHEKSTHVVVKSTHDKSTHDKSTQEKTTKLQKITSKIENLTPIKSLLKIGEKKSSEH